ncbi:YheT family hydrolase [Tenacibaculum sp. M341]|uniref:YheT family hydrolase n=1 Tax=Tenacibaculum sp. M341 TaxID=2530339 RepID=UPI00104F768D|nr:alpha/beta fold hydrolase [Tenacibaculum sp. M341]TCI91002.1 alpha/beta fold hydrolase [Tenacibaculum sp. M341]
MPILETQLNTSFPFKNAHVNTIYKYFLTKDAPEYTRKRIDTWDNDFIDLDFLMSDSYTLVLLIHGLEGSSQSSYMLSNASYLHNLGYDVACMNLRSCSGEDNNLLQTYHSGKTDDVDFIINYLTENYDYQNIVICGFSLGGNLTLKYLGEYADEIPNTVKGGIAVSVPIDLTSSQIELTKLKNIMYKHEFLRTLRAKVMVKASKFPEYNPDKKQLMKATTFRHFEEIYTAPIFGFENPEDYYEKASSKPYLNKIQHKTLLINAKDDTFLSDECYPYDIAENSEHFYLMTPDYGGHVGFVSSFKNEDRWIEKQIVNFIQNQLNIFS